MPPLNEIDHGFLDNKRDLAKMILEEPVIVIQECVGEDHVT